MKYLALVICISLLPLISIFSTPDLLHTHDGLVHIPRIAAFFKALSDGHFPVRWAGDLNYGYGMPLFNFIYQTPYYIASLFLLLKAGLVESLKLTLALSFVLSGITMYLFSKTFFQDEKKAILVTLFYQFAPFRLVELLIRGSLGEVYTYVFFPLVLFGLTKFFAGMSYGYFLLTSIATAILVISHNSVSLMFFAVLCGFVLFFAGPKKKMALGFAGLSLGLVLSAFYWVPALFEHRYTYGDLFMKNLYLPHFVPIQNFFIPNLFNSKELQTEGISAQIGLFHVTAILVSLWLLVKSKIDRNSKKLLIFSFLLLTFSFFFMQPVSKPLWERISFLRQFQFPWRFLSVVSFATALLSVVFLKLPIFRNTRVYIVLLLLVIATTVFYWRPSLGYDKIDQSYYWNFPLTTTYFGETDVIWSAGPAKAYAKEPVEVISGNATVSAYTRKTQLHTFTVDVQTGARLVDHTQYFPGWRVTVDGKPETVEFQDQNWQGQITFPVSEGKHTVQVAFGESKLRLFADFVSLGTFLSLMVGLLGRSISLR